MDYRIELLGRWVDTYPLLLTLAISAGVLLALGRLWRGVAPDQRWAVLTQSSDALLAGLAAGLLGARAVHVLLNWDYFSTAPAAIPRWDGLEWHGALLALPVAALRLRVGRAAVRPGALLAAAAPAVGLLTLAGWAGCLAALCGVGAEVSNAAAYPPLLVSESVDLYGTLAPRFDTPLLGMLLGAAAVGVTLIGPPTPRRFWTALLVVALGMAAIGFLRGDAAPRLLGLRADQGADLLVAVLAGYGIVRRINVTSNE